VADPDLHHDFRLIREKGSDLTVGGVRPWSSRERKADESGLTGPEREWSLYYETATWFHRTSNRHLFVTADSKVVEAFGGGTDKGGSPRRVFGVRGALMLAGLLMRTRDLVYLGSRLGYKGNFDFYMYLSHALAPSRVRLHRWHGARGPGDDRSSLLDLEQSMAARVIDLLKASDGVAFPWLKHQDNATLDDMLYHLRAAIPTAAALFDSIALFAAGALGITPSDVGGQRARLSLRDGRFRQALTSRGAHRLAELSKESGPLWKMIGELRNPVIHGSGIGGMTYLALGAGIGRESRLTLRTDQATAVLAAAQWAGDSGESWGLEPSENWQPSPPKGLEPMLDIFGFTRRFVSTAITTADRLTTALADDLNAPPLAPATSRDGQDCEPCFALLAGMADDLAAARERHA
jgi:hypothetical protein